MNGNFGRQERRNAREVIKNEQLKRDEIMKKYVEPTSQCCAQAYLRQSINYICAMVKYRMLELKHIRILGLNIYFHPTFDSRNIDCHGQISKLGSYNVSFICLVS